MGALPIVGVPRTVGKACLPRVGSLSPKCRTFAAISTSEPAFDVDHLIVGGGIVGMAVAERLSRRAGTSSILIEKHAHLGFETTSRNSQVIHAGIYYSVDSLKAKVCIRGKELLYDLCQKHSIPHWNCGKWIVAAPEEKNPVYLEDIHKKATALGVPTYFLPAAKIADEPLVRAGTVLVSPTTGIVDSHGVLDHLNYMFTQGNAEKGLGEGDVVRRSQVTGIERDEQGNWIVEVKSLDSEGAEGTSKIRTRILVNAAGLYSDEIAGMAMGKEMVEKLGYTIYPCKGRYYAYASSKKLASRLIYPAPEKNFVGLGIHLTLDLAGRAKFGPDTLYVDQKDDYAIDPNDEALRTKFWESVKRYLPVVEKDDIVADYSGIRCVTGPSSFLPNFADSSTSRSPRPKLSGPGQAARDFVVKEESDNGFPGLVSLVGIESPGLTSSLAIAEMVGDMVGN